MSGRPVKNLAEILLSYRKTKKPKKRPRARPAGKQPLIKKAKLLPCESWESSEFEETEEEEEEEPPSADDDDEDETQETQVPDRGALPSAWLPLQQKDQWGARRGVPIRRWRSWRMEIPKDILQQKTKLGRAGTIYWVPADYKSAVWHSVGEYCVAARSHAKEEECKDAAAVASATRAVPAPSARKKLVKAKRPKKKRKTRTKSGGRQEEEDAGEGDKEDAREGDKEDTEKKARLQYRCQAMTREPGLRKLHWTGTLVVVRFCCCLQACMCICKRRVIFFEKYLRSNIRRFVRRKVLHISKKHFQGI